MLVVCARDAKNLGKKIGEVGLDGVTESLDA